MFIITSLSISIYKYYIKEENMEYITWIYINTIRRLSTYIANKYYKWIKLPKNKTLVQSEIQRLNKTIKNFEDIITEGRKFNWVSDPGKGVVDWSPNIISFLIRNKQDDCDGSGYYIKYLCNLINIPCKTVSLLSKKPFFIDSHVINFVYYNNQIHLFSNGTKAWETFTNELDAIRWYNEISGTEYFEWFVEIKYPKI
jgi:hypothetical protein